MNSRFLTGLSFAVPACFTFGPMFMSNVAGTNYVGVGTWMVIFGLVWTFGMTRLQQNEIRALREELQKKS